MAILKLLIFWGAMSPWVYGFQQTYLKASNTWGFDRFGSAVAIDGDTLVVGAFRKDSGSPGVNAPQLNDDADNSGAVYVFVRDGGSWIQQAYLKASNPGAGDNFGISVSISGDTLVVGSHRESSSSAGINGDQLNDDLRRSGAAYVFTREEGVWSQQAYLKASNPGANDNFGLEVDIFGDLVVVGATGESSLLTSSPGEDAAPNAGAAYIFRRTAGVWVQEAFLKADNAREESYFGISVTVSGETVVVGASGDDGLLGSGIPDSGAAFVFEGAGGVWTQKGYLKASNADAADLFGGAVDLDGNRLVIGASGEDGGEVGVRSGSGDNSLLNSGAAYLFERNNGIWVETHYLKAVNAGQGDNFGVSVAIDGGLLVVGANDEDSSAQGLDGNGLDNSALDAGAAYLYRLRGATWSFSRCVKASNAESGDAFGREVAISGETFIIGARDEDSSATGVNQAQGNETGELESGENSGAVYAFDAEPADFPTVILAVSPTGAGLEVLFEGLPGKGDWQLFGGASLSMPSNLTGASSLQELAPGKYLFTTNQTVSPLRFFVEVGR
jgi:hypothetical protein